MRKKISETDKQIISERAKERCEYCKSMQKYSPQPFVNEHIIPLAEEGSNDLVPRPRDGFSVWRL